MVKNISFWGSSEVSLPSLIKLAENFDIKAVITSPDRPKGRGRKLSPSVVKEKAGELGIKDIFTPERLNKDFKEKYFSLDIDIAVVVSYGKIIPEKILDYPEFGTLNLHFSLLPKLRGASPVETAILKGVETTGISIIKLVKKLDAGPVYSQIEYKINPNEYAYEIKEKLAFIGAEELGKTIKNIKTITPFEQDEKRATYAKKIEKKDGKFDWSYDSEKILRMIRAFTPWPSAWTFVNNRRVIFIEAEKSKLDGETRGEIIKIERNGFHIVCGDNKAIFVKKVKPEGKRIIPAADFLNGVRFKEGTVV